MYIPLLCDPVKVALSNDEPKDEPLPNDPVNSKIK